ncbi:hypothetical protein FRC07_014303, partial [Ceratobasidium sp. 392]
TTQDRTWQETAYPSEPLLSCAAAQIMYPPKGLGAVQEMRNVETMLRHLEEAVSSGLIAGSPQGELVSRLVYLISKDLAIRQNEVPPVEELTSELVDCKPPPVVDYLDFMFGLDKLGDAARILDGWYINFSHWISMSEKIEFEGSESERSF